MSSDALRRQFQEVMAQFEPRRPADPALMGDGLGNVAVSGRDGYVYVRVGSELLVGHAYNNRVPNRENLPVIVGYSSAQPELFQVLSIREVYAGADTGDKMIPAVVAHHNSHELGNADGGDDVVYVQKQQIIPLLAYETDPASMYISIAADWYPWQSGFKFFAGATSADLSGYVPGTSGQARYVLVTVDGATNVLQYTSGDTWAIYLPPADLSTLVPDAPAGSVPVVAIYLPNGTTAITRKTNLYDVRILISPVGGSLTPAVHDHSEGAEGGILPATSTEIEEIGTATYDDLQDWLNAAQSSGRITGGAITSSTDAVTAVTVGGAGAGEFKVAGDRTAIFVAALVITVDGSTNNDGAYTVSAGGSAHAAGVTTIPVDEAVAAVADGDIYNGRANVAAGTGFIKVADSGNALTKSFDWAETNDIALTITATNYVHLNYNAGAPIVEATDDRPTINLHTEFTLGLIYRGDDGRTYPMDSGVNVPDFLRHEHERLILVRGFERASGGIVTEVAGRKFAVSAGVFYRGMNKITSTAKTSDADKFTYVYYDGADWVWVEGQSVIDNQQYNNIAAGLADLSNNKYGIGWVCIDYSGNLFVVYGQGDYTLTEAQNAPVPALMPVVAGVFGKIAAKIIIEEDGAAFEEIISAYETTIPSASPATHNDLGGLNLGDYQHLTAAEKTATDHAIHDNETGEIAAVAEKAVPVNADLVLIEDSADANAKKRVQVTNLPPVDHDHSSAAEGGATLGAHTVNADLTLDDGAGDSPNAIFKTYSAIYGDYTWRIYGNDSVPELRISRNGTDLFRFGSGLVLGSLVGTRSGMLDMANVSALPLIRLDQRHATHAHIRCTKQAADVDFPAIIELQVTGNPTFWWDESEDAFGFKNLSGILVEDNDWIGLGAAKGRIEFHDEATDNIQLLGCNVGIGMVPVYKFQVAGKGILVQAGTATAGTTFMAGGYATFGELRGSGTFFGDNVVASTTVSGQMNIANTSATLGARGIFMQDETGIAFHTVDGAVTAGNAFSSERVRIDESGDVGINDTTPGTKLEVVGTVTATKFTDTGGGYDFFMPNPSKPDEEMLRHWAIETDGMRTLYAGQGETSIVGRTTIKLPEWFAGLAEVESCSLTPVGSLGNLAINLDTLEVISENPQQAFCWLIVAKRIDKMAQNVLIDHPVVEPRDKNSRKHVKFVWNEISSGDMIKADVGRVQEILGQGAMS